MATASTTNADGSGSSSASIQRPAFGSAFQIVPGVQMYDWGIKGKDGSLVAEFGTATEQLQLRLEDHVPYAELWMGTHPSLPSKIVTPPSELASANCTASVSLSDYLHQYPTLLGDKVVARYGTGLTRNGGATDEDGKPKDRGALPFLFKILSAGKALSIQAHPDKELAKRLHREKPKLYRDDNHKPEMAIALTPFKGFCGFRPLPEIIEYLTVIPEFQALVQPTDELLSELQNFSKKLVADASSVDEEKVRGSLRQIFSALMKASHDDIVEQTQKISQRYATAESSKLEVSWDVARLVCMLYEQFPKDIGIFCTFVLNIVTMQPGQAIFLKANEPHAYISGNIVECMAASDNVVRAGLTLKERDVDVLVEMLTYTSGGSYKQFMKPRPLFADDASSGSSSAPTATLVYDPPIDEFSVALTRLEAGQRQSQHGLQGPSIAIVTAGKGTLVARKASSEGADVILEVNKPGKVFFLGAGINVDVVAAEDISEPLTVYRAFVEA